LANWPPYALGLLKSIAGTHWPRRTTRIRLIGGLMGENVRFVISLGFASRSVATPAQASRASHRCPSALFTPERQLLHERNQHLRTRQQKHVRILHDCLLHQRATMSQCSASSNLTPSASWSHGPTKMLDISPRRGTRRFQICHQVPRPAINTGPGALIRHLNKRPLAWHMSLTLGRDGAPPWWHWEAAHMSTLPPAHTCCPTLLCTPASSENATLYSSTS
jgi:hypothetical protein